MKVLIICTEKLPVPPVLGGAIQTYISGVVPVLKEKHSVTILGVNDPSLPDEEMIDGINYVRVPGKLLEIYRDGVKEYVKNNRFDLIHIFNRPRLVPAVREAAPDARLILSMHNDMFKREKIDPETANRAIEELDKIITISDYIGQTIKELYPQAEGKLQTIYSGVDLDRFVPAYTAKGKKLSRQVREEHDLTLKKIVLFAGRLSPNKGPDVLVRAMRLLQKEHPDAVLVIVGSKWFSQEGLTDYIAYLRAVAARSPIPVITTGFVSPAEIHRWFAAADVFVCTSRWQEPLARVHYEAMAAGLPIITTNRGGNTEVMEEGKNGLIVNNAEDPEEFARHLSHLLSDSSRRRKMGEYGRMLAEKNYNWNRVVSDISGVWDEIEVKINNNIPITAQYGEKQELITEEIITLNDTASEETVKVEYEEKELEPAVQFEEKQDLVTEEIITINDTASKETDKVEYEEKELEPAVQFEEKQDLVTEEIININDTADEETDKMPTEEKDPVPVVQTAEEADKSPKEEKDQVPAGQPAEGAEVDSTKIKEEIVKPVKRGKDHVLNRLGKTFPKNPYYPHFKWVR
ncbi:glycosyltransferase family 4 protein [Evansella clarkii]|uniref:glycosyltransferase family 4 protein n=1 Tax=Evansella clarkii TaxID=79879 RepID=UPI000B43244E|nr:glycosyltransferase family 4 protein [Evansella clarkii]